VLILDAESDNYSGVWVTWVLLFLNLFSFILQMSVGDRITYGFSLVPAEITTGQDLVTPQEVKIPVLHEVGTKTPRGQINTRYEVRQEWVTVPQYPGPWPIQLTLLTCMFLHGGFTHLADNMLFLAVFGRHVEACLRPGLFLAAYLFCGIVGGLAHVLHTPDSVLPCLGASGAISGVLGAYLFLRPFGWVSVLGKTLRLPAFVVLGLWVLLQVLAVALGAESMGIYVGFWAHLGGFAAGPAFILCVIAFLKAFGEPTEPAADQPEQELGNFLPPRKSQRSPAEEDHNWR
jgi:membrane associated rhomboid family serine protease